MSQPLTQTAVVPVTQAQDKQDPSMYDSMRASMYSYEQRVTHLQGCKKWMFIIVVILLILLVAYLYCEHKAGHAITWSTISSIPSKVLDSAFETQTYVSTSSAAPATNAVVDGIIMKQA